MENKLQWNPVNVDVIPTYMMGFNTRTRTWDYLNLRQNHYWVPLNPRKFLLAELNEYNSFRRSFWSTPNWGSRAQGQ